MFLGVSFREHIGQGNVVFEVPCVIPRGLDIVRTITIDGLETFRVAEAVKTGSDSNNWS